MAFRFLILSMWPCWRDESRSSSLTHLSSFAYMRLYKFRSMCASPGINQRERVLDIVNGFRLYCEKWQSFDDGCEGAYWRLKDFTLKEMSDISAASPFDRERIIEEMGLLRKSEGEHLRVCSLTEGPLDNETMWTKYGDCHRGVAIEFEVLSGVLRPPLYKVRYGDDCVRNIFGVLADVNGEIERMTESLLTWKRHEFIAENEVRLICGQNKLLPRHMPNLPTHGIEAAIYKLDSLMNNENCYFSFKDVLKVCNVWCGRKISPDDLEFLKSNVRDVSVCCV